MVLDEYAGNRGRLYGRFNHILRFAPDEMR